MSRDWTRAFSKKARSFLVKVHGAREGAGEYENLEDWFLFWCLFFSLQLLSACSQFTRIQCPACPAMAIMFLDTETHGKRISIHGSLNRRSFPSMKISEGNSLFAHFSQLPNEFLWYQCSAMAGSARLLCSPHPDFVPNFRISAGTYPKVGWLRDYVSNIFPNIKTFQSIPLSWDDSNTLRGERILLLPVLSPPMEVHQFLFVLEETKKVAPEDACLITTEANSSIV